MPNRILRETILDSAAVNALAHAEEVFYRRLMSVVDDFGRFDGRPAVLRARLFPLRLDQVAEADVVAWLTACARSGLVELYAVEGKPFLVVVKFQQNRRARDSKYPAPPDGDGAQAGADARSCAQLRPYSETNAETDAQAQAPPAAAVGWAVAWLKFWSEYPKHRGRAEAAAAFRAIDPDAELLAAILAGLGKAKRSADWTREGGRFIPSAAAWLADRRWEEFAARPRRPRPPPPDDPPPAEGGGAEAWRALRLREG